jgi:HPt (histidine-containing phosphotransfer) domain-containing protein
MSGVFGGPDMPAREIPPAPTYPAFVRPAFDAKLLDLIPGYLDRKIADIVQMRADLADGLFEMVVRRAHRIKGTGASYGMPYLSEVAARLEQTARLGEAALARELIDDLGRYLDVVRATL